MGCNTNLETHINALDSTSQVPFPSHFPLTITDSSGQPITFAQPPERIIVLDSASIEILFSINEGHRIVGTHSFVTYPDEVKTIPKVGNAFEINFERIVELNPDLIFIFYDRFLSDLKRLGFNVLFLKSADLNLSDISNQILLWGQITGNTPKAIEKAIEFFISCQASSGGFGYTSKSGPNQPRSAIGCLVLALSKDTDSKAYKQSVKYLMENAAHDGQGHKFYSLYYTSQAVFRADPSLWRVWNSKNVKRLLATQSEDGSWNGNYGKAFSTSAALLSLALNYRYLPIYER